MVSVLACYSDDTSSNPADTYSFFLKFVFEKKEKKQKEARVGLFKKLFVEYFVHFFSLIQNPALHDCDFFISS